MGFQEKIKICTVSTDSEGLYFARQEEERIRALRETAYKEADEKYAMEHKMHCFRCGTPSLVEVEHNGLKIDICVNEGCGAVHLDPGELDALTETKPGALKKVHVAVFNIFK